MSEKECENKAAYRFTWPGNDESYICEDHSTKLKGVAAAIGLHLQLVPTLGPDIELETCKQKVRA